jgi:hypothetical protein
VGSTLVLAHPLYYKRLVQLASIIFGTITDRSVKIPREIVEDVLIKVDKFYFPVDFIVLDTEPV